jgi:Protein of unknown function (DUF2950)
MQKHTFACALIAAAVAAMTSCARSEPQPQQQMFASAEEAVQELAQVVQAANVQQLTEIFGPDSKELVDTSDPVTARRNRETFTAAFAEGWKLVDNGQGGRTLVIGNEEWPFPVPLVADGNRWRFDTAAGKTEVLARRIGRNELAVIRICSTYVAAQRRYAEHGHDGKPARLYAQSFGSDPGKENGLFWPEVKGKPLSPLGDLVAQAASEGRPIGEGQQRTPFQGYYFKILTAQGPAASGGAKSYVANGEMSGGFALVAWPAEYDLTGITTFIVNQDGIVYEKDLGADSAATAGKMSEYNPDESWKRLE